MGSPTVGSIFVQRVIIGVGDAAVSNNTQVVLSTYALGSCIGVAVYEPRVRVGGILHLMLPDSKISPAKASAQPAMFADTGLPLLFRQLATFGAQPGNLQVFVAGGASVISGDDPFKIGERNRTATLTYLSKIGVRVKSSDLGGSINRTLHLELANGDLTMKTPTEKFAIPLGV